MLLVEPLLDRERDPQADPPGADGAVLDHRGDAGDLGLAEAVDGGRGAIHGEADRVLDRVGGGAGERDRLLDHRSLLPQAARATADGSLLAWFAQAMQARVDGRLPAEQLARQQALTRRYATAFLERYLARDRRFAGFRAPADAAAEGADVALTARPRRAGSAAKGSFTRERLP